MVWLTWRKERSFERPIIIFRILNDDGQTLWDCFLRRGTAFFFSARGPRAGVDGLAHGRMEENITFIHIHES